MKNLLTENEKNEIRQLYGLINNFSQKKDNRTTIYEEKNKIRKLMNLPLLLETWNPSNIFKEVDCLKPLAKGMDNLTGAVDDFVKNIGDYSSALAAKGIRNSDDLYRAAIEWQEANKGILKNQLQDAALIDRYLVQTGTIKELEQALINKTIRGIENKTLTALNSLEDELLVNAERNSLAQEELDMLGGLRQSADVGDDITKEALEGNKQKIVAAQEKIIDIKKNIQKRIAELTPEGGKIADDVTEEALKALKKIEKELDSVSTALTRQTESVDAAITTIVKREVDIPNTIKWNGVEYNAAGLSKVEYTLLKFGVDRLPGFIYQVIKFIVRLWRGKSLQVELMENLSKLKELVTIKRTYNESQWLEEMNLVNKQIRNTIDSLNGKYFNLDPAAKKTAGDYIKEVIGIGGTDLETTWKTIVSILDNEVKLGNLTNSESIEILENIKKVYGEVKGGNRVSADDLNAFSGLLKFREDLQDMGKAVGVEDFTTKFDDAIVKEAAATDYVEGLGKMLSKTLSELTGEVKTIVGQFFKGIGKVFIRWFTYGLPFNLRSYYKPIALYGFNVKSTVMVLSRLMVGKFMATFFFGGLISVIQEQLRLWFVLGLEPGYTAEDAERDGWASWENEMKPYYDLDFGSMITDVLDTDETEIMATRRASGKEYISDAKREYGPLTFKWKEVFVEYNSWMAAKPDREQNDSWIIEQEQKNAENMKNKVRNELEEKEDLYYSLNQEEQDRVSGVANKRYALSDKGVGALSELDSGTKNLINERLFAKVNFTGTMPTSLESDQEIKTIFLNADNYKGYPCVCKKPLKYVEKDIKVGLETKKVTVPSCDDYVRLIDLSQKNFTDGNLLNNERKDLQPFLGKTGFVVGKSATSGIPSVNDWKPISQINSYIKN
jgi:hypothetical protein